MYTALTTVQKFFPEVKSVSDSKVSLQIEVTKQDEKISRRGNHKECAFAVACKRRFKIDGVVIARSVAYLIKNKKAIRFDVPGTVSREIVSFDRGAGFSSGTYHLDAAYRSRLLVNRPRGPHKAKGKKPSRFHHVTNKIRASLAESA